MTTIYEAAGGMEVFVRLAEATHQRCLADPLLNHPFSHADNQPDHTERLAAYWAEALGGPPTYTTDDGRQRVARAAPARGRGRLRRRGEPALRAVRRRLLRRGRRARRPAGAPGDHRLRHVGRDRAVPGLAGRSTDDVPDDLALPRWDWDGPVS